MMIRFYSDTKIVVEILSEAVGPNAKISPPMTKMTPPGWVQQKASILLPRFWSRNSTKT